MATANGSLTPPTQETAISSPSTSKRKRSPSASEAHAHATAQNESQDLRSTDNPIKSLMKDFLSVLTCYDTQPSILNHALHTSNSRLDHDGPDIKRAKLAENGVATSIASKLSSGSYSSLDALVEDVEDVSAELVSSLKSSEFPYNGSSRQFPQSLEGARLVAGLLAFKKIMRNILLRETQRKGRSEAFSEQKEEFRSDTKPGDVAVAAGAASKVPPEPSDGRAVLTLFANAPNPKQLFSSVQNPRKVSASTTSRETIPLDTSVKVNVPLQEGMLPSIISTTRIVPIHAADPPRGKQGNPTIGELFASPTTVPQLSAPKPAKPLTTRGNTITWVPQESVNKSNKKPLTFFNQGQSTSQWLGYGGLDAPKEPSSEAKQKSRQRALSSGEANPRPSDSALAAMQQAKEDALFRSAYSSFAPTHDDSVAIVPEETKNRIWWHKVGEKRYQETIAIDPMLLEEEASQTIADISLEDRAKREEEEFKRAVDNFDPALVDDDLEVRLKKDESDDPEDVLKGISELLETLHSHQKIRNAQIPTSARTPASQTTSLTAIAGTPSSPSSAETDVYSLLKNQIATIVSSLPPYAVAKLDGDQLADLSISRNLLIETKDYRGVMEEDQVSRLSKAAALSAAAGASQGIRGGTHSQYGSTNHYNRTSSNTHATPRSSAQTPTSYYPQQQPPSRSPSMQYHRPSSGVGYQTPVNYSASGPRPGYNSAQSLNAQTPRPGSYNTPNLPQHYQQRATPHGYNHPAGYYHGSNQNQSQNRSYSATHGYQQRPQNISSMYNNASLNPASPQSPHPRTGSPLKGGQSSTQTPHYNQARPPGYNTPMAQMRPGASPQKQPPPPPSSSGSQHPQQVPTASALGPSGFHSSMSTAEQQNMLDRQRSQLAAKSAAGLSKNGAPPYGTPPVAQMQSHMQQQSPPAHRASPQTNGTGAGQQMNGASPGPGGSPVSSASGAQVS